MLNLTVEKENIAKSVSLDPKKYKLTVEMNSVEPVEMKIKIMKVDSKNYCVAFTRKSGDSFEFINAFTKIRKATALLANTTQ